MPVLLSLDLEQVDVVVTTAGGIEEDFIKVNHEMKAQWRAHEHVCRLVRPCG